MEHVTKQQLILISLLVAIVTAVSTSVATVSLMDTNATPGQTIYKVIEKSIENVTDSTAVKSIVGATTVTKSEPSVLSPSDIADVKSNSVVRIYEKTGEGNKFVALGVAIGTKGALLASALQNPHVEGAQYYAVVAGNKEIPVRYDRGEVASKFSVFVLQYDTKDKKRIPTLLLKSFATIKLGSNVVALGGKESGDVVSTGIVTEMKSLDTTVTASSTKDILFTDMTLTTDISGWLLFDTMGNLVAIEKGIDESTKSPVFINAKIVAEAIKEYL